MYSLIQSILGFVYYWYNIGDSASMGVINDGGVTTAILQQLELGNLSYLGITSEQLGANLLQVSRYEAIATLVITVLVVWLICKLICRIFDC